jgi:hypothetical protein
VLGSPTEQTPVFAAVEGLFWALTSASLKHAWSEQR